MSYETFNRFLQQLHAHGREKGDGFDHSHFQGLSADERVEAARLLREALLSGDDTAAEGLVLLDSAAAREPLEEAIQTSGKSPLYTLTLAEVLWKLTGESRYQDIMIDLLQHHDHSIRWRALGGLETTPHNDRLMAEIKNLVINDPDDNIRYRAAKHLLYGLGLIPKFQDVAAPYKQILLNLSDENKEIRKKALSELDGK
ncbi:MAG: hypothetical protein J2P41_12925 [Blastocatellia bacterium]|nr:hypothetical protein [Blastocatellia bacterium]